MKRFLAQVTLTCLITLVIAGGCGKQDLVRIAVSKDPKATAKRLITHRHHHYEQNPLLLISDIKQFRRHFQAAVKALKREAAQEWGSDDAQVASSHRYVKYIDNYRSRSLIDFDAGWVRVETVAEDSPRQHLRNALITTFLTPDDPRAVDLYSDKAVRLQGTPYLQGLIVDQRGQAINSAEHAQAYADYLLDHRLQIQDKTIRQQSRRVHSVTVSMVPNHTDVRARRYRNTVNQFSRRYGISRSLIYAIIKTESNFNPFAVSHAPAYGLMQLVPTTGGRDAYRQVHGRDGIPSPEYLFDSQRNIELGSAYLHILQSRYLNAIQHPVAREYCVIAAYNAGAGTVLRSFAADRSHALAIINRMSPNEVYQRLRHHLRSHEARRYLVKVLQARTEFVRL